MASSLRHHYILFGIFSLLNNIRTNTYWYGTYLIIHAPPSPFTFHTSLQLISLIHNTISHFIFIAFITVGFLLPYHIIISYWIIIIIIIICQNIMNNTEGEFLSHIRRIQYTFRSYAWHLHVTTSHTVIHTYIGYTICHATYIFLIILSQAEIWCQLPFTWRILHIRHEQYGTRHLHSHWSWRWWQPRLQIYSYYTSILQVIVGHFFIIHIMVLLLRFPSFGSYHIMATELHHIGHSSLLVLVIYLDISQCLHHIRSPPS